MRFDFTIEIELLFSGKRNRNEPPHLLEAIRLFEALTRIEQKPLLSDIEIISRRRRRSSQSQHRIAFLYSPCIHNRLDAHVRVETLIGVRLQC